MKRTDASAAPGRATGATVEIRGWIDQSGVAYCQTIVRPDGGAPVYTYGCLGSAATDGALEALLDELRSV